MRIDHKVTIQAKIERDKCIRCHGESAIGPLKMCFECSDYFYRTVHAHFDVGVDIQTKADFSEAVKGLEKTLIEYVEHKWMVDGGEES